MSKRHKEQNRYGHWKFTIDEICEQLKISKKEFYALDSDRCLIAGALASCFGDASCGTCPCKFVKKDCIQYTNYLTKNKGVRKQYPKDNKGC